MAPEYIIKGQLIEKADVYNYGVLVLEIVTKALDPSLKGNFPPEEALKVLKVGLLCTQEYVSLRPSMYDDIQILTTVAQPIPEPRQPPFLKSYISIKSLVSNTLSKLDGSYTSTTENSSNMQSSSDGPHRSEQEFVFKKFGKTENKRTGI
ncbi:hypothetical protein RND71_008229 [Anisodus tanguticus]|uniref:Serine-threonine/tyrosine-protein kinase catalytic domain-containing protein n=1 Tax=Anisodus tanguticus TaxID=243964 RepID=A0AAE1SNC2_9SOLA|nr:hypothetical protein RND71_008229 [Anisodus tanguticus]